MVFLLLTCLAPAARADVTGDDVRRAVRRAVDVLRARQLQDGSWPEKYYPGGESALVTLALLQAGAKPDDPAVRRAVSFLRDVPDEHTYVVALKIMVLGAVDPAGQRAAIADSANWLIHAQNRSGLWNYTPAGERFDHSNSQFALLGLNAAADAGFSVPQGVWQKAQEAVLKSQLRDGGWSYQAGGISYGSMTAAGVADLLILGHLIQAGREHGFRNGAAPGCGTYRLNRPLASGMTWLSKNFVATSNPRREGPFLYYWLYAAERVGMLSGQRFFGPHDWYREGAAHLVRSQGRSGLWSDDLSNTAFAVLYLAKGHKALVVQKLQWSDDDAWSPDRHDVEHLADFLGDRLGEPVAWQTVRLDAPLEEWLAAPLLYFQGHTFPRFSEAQKTKLHEFIERGGTILAEACCGRDEFRKGFEVFTQETFREAPLRELGDEHPVFHALFDVSSNGLMGIDLGCRTSVLYSPNDLSCLWEQANIPEQSENALRLGANIAAYVTGRRPLRDRLDVVTVPRDVSADPVPSLGEGLRLAQVVYDGDWRPDPLALVHFAEFLRTSLGIDVVSRYREQRLTDSSLYASPVLYMTGHYPLHFSQAEREALANHLRRGGFLLSEACCGRPAFDESFRNELAAAIPEARLERLPPDHPVFAGKPGFAIDKVGIKPFGDDPGGARAPELWGLFLKGRLAVVYSPVGIGCGLDGHTCYQCHGLVEEDARRLAANVVLYALLH